MFDDWEGDGRAVQFLDLNAADAIRALADRYGIPGEIVLTDVISHAVSLGAQTVAIEYRYIDPDYRDEHAKFWSSTFRRYPSVAHRLHFFRDLIADVNTSVKPFHFEAFDYVGYAVMRPIPAAPVGRTMLPPPPSDASPLIWCEAIDHVNLLGSDLRVRGVPFYSQDAQLTRCGQAAMLATGYYYHLAFGELRMLPGGIAYAAGANAGELGRWMPSPGVNLTQLVDTATAMRVPPVVYPIASLTEDTERVICRYLNSKFPVTVFTKHHAFLLVGYRMETDTDGTNTVAFLRHDDEVGPYRWVTLKEVDDYGEWQYLVVPMPPKVYMVAERAEAVGEAQFEKLFTASAAATVDKALHARIEAGEVIVRSAAVTSNDFKRTLKERDYPDDVVVRYQAMRMSRYIWVIELTEKAARNDGNACVLGEVLIDATDHPEAARLLAWRIPSGMGWSVIDTPREQFSTSYAATNPVHSVITHIRPQKHPI